MPPDPAVLGYDYFPLRTGDVKIYDVVRIDHNIDQSSDTTYYQLKEIVGEKFISGGEESYRIERSTRSKPTDEWQVEAVWSARRNTYQAIVVENNTPIIKLSFPLEEDRRWNGNAMNSLEFDEFKMVNFGQSYTVGGLTFTASVELIKEETFDPSQTTKDIYNIEVFARGVGMIYRVDLDRTYCTESPCSPSGIAFGQEIEYKLAEYELVN